MSLRTQIPAFYWYFGTIIDPLLCLYTIITIYFTPQTFLDPGFPNAKITPPLTFVLHQLGGAFIAWAFLYLTLLRETNEIRVWTRVQQALSFTDLAVLFGQWKALDAQGRLGLGKLRWEEWANVVILLMILAVRVGFIAGIGFGMKADKKRT